MKRSSILLAIAFLFAVVASFWLGSSLTRKRYESALNRPDTVIVEKWVRDTAKNTGSRLVATIPIFLPLFVPDPTEVHDTTTVRDSVLVEVPITEKSYVGENYRATIRGFQAELTDIWVKQKEVTITIPYRKHWSITLGPQLGVGFTPKGFQPYAGVGVTFGYSF